MITWILGELIMSNHNTERAVNNNINKLGMSSTSRAEGSKRELAAYRIDVRKRRTDGRTDGQKPDQCFTLFVMNTARELSKLRHEILAAELTYTKRQSQMSDSAPPPVRCCPLEGQFEYAPLCHISADRAAPIELLWIYASLRSPCIPNRYAPTWRHPRNRKYVKYRNAARKGPSHEYDTDKNGEDSGDMLAETHRHTKPRCIRSTPALLGRWPRLVLAPAVV